MARPTTATITKIDLGDIELLERVQELVRTTPTLAATLQDGARKIAQECMNRPEPISEEKAAGVVLGIFTMSFRLSERMGIPLAVDGQPLRLLKRPETTETSAQDDGDEAQVEFYR